jgi:hypothetical protein
MDAEGAGELSASGFFAFSTIPRTLGYDLVEEM